jgi:small subunit ribosomal protein S18
MGRKSTNSDKRPQQGRRRGPDTRRIRTKPCAFCSDKAAAIDWKDVAVLRKYTSDRAKIRPRRVTGNCPRHQRQIAVAIKNAREMALLPYISTR